MKGYRFVFFCFLPLLRFCHFFRAFVAFSRCCVLMQLFLLQFNCQKLRCFFNTPSTAALPAVSSTLRSKHCNCKAKMLQLAMFCVIRHCRCSSIYQQTQFANNDAKSNFSFSSFLKLKRYIIINCLFLGGVLNYFC